MEYFRVRSRAGLGVAALFAATVLSGAACKADADLSGIYWATEYHPKIAAGRRRRTAVHRCGQGRL